MNVIEYLPYIVAAIVLVLILVYGIMTGKVKRWLEYAVSEAESQLGSGTGQLKLRKVYDWFITQFPFFSKILPFSVFSKLVDAALVWMRSQIENNNQIKAVIEG